MADRLVGHLAHLFDHLVGKPRRGLRLDDHHAVVADDDAGIGVALGGEGPETSPTSLKLIFFSVMSPCDANALAMGSPCQVRCLVKVCLPYLNRGVALRAMGLQASGRAVPVQAPKPMGSRRPVLRRAGSACRRLRGRCGSRRCPGSNGSLPPQLSSSSEPRSCFRAPRSCRSPSRSPAFIGQPDCGVVRQLLGGGIVHLVVVGLRDGHGVGLPSGGRVNREVDVVEHRAGFLQIGQKRDFARRR